jgi:phosphate starvation-inducible protein PhoH
MSKISRKARRRMQREGLLDQEGKVNKKKFKINENLYPLTPAQVEAKEAWDEGYDLDLHGCAGTGKSFLGLWFALEQLIKGNIEQIIVVRSAVQGREQGHLPGTAAEKAAEYFKIYKPLIEQILGDQNAYDLLVKSQQLIFETTSFNRGITFDNAVILVDETQNMNFQELDTIITRGSDSTRYILSGDTKQDDLTGKRRNDSSGLAQFQKILDEMPEFDGITFFPEDIVRGGRVKSYIMTKERLGM